MQHSRILVKSHLIINLIYNFFLVLRVIFILSIIVHWFILWLFFNLHKWALC